MESAPRGRVMEDIRAQAALVRLAEEDLRDGIAKGSTALLAMAVRSLHGASFELNRLYGELQGIDAAAESFP